MTLRVFLTVFEIVLLVAVLAYFLNRVAGQLMHISDTLGKVAFGVRAVETQCGVIGPAADRINASLEQTAAGLGQAAQLAEELAD
ncbi:hypothetical protein BH20ACT2_BH20ACT2_20830 [soil metagenome]